MNKFVIRRFNDADRILDFMEEMFASRKFDAPPMGAGIGCQLNAKLRLYFAVGKHDDGNNDYAMMIWATKNTSGMWGSSIMVYNDAFNSNDSDNDVIVDKIKKFVIKHAFAKETAVEDYSVSDHDLLMKLSDIVGNSAIQRIL